MSELDQLLRLLFALATTEGAQGRRLEMEQDPETEYLTQRLREIRADLQESAAAQETVEELRAFVVDALTRAGNAPLAERWRVHYQAFRDAVAVFASAIERSDAAAADTAQEAMSDAQEAYERVEADVNAFLQRAEKGGQ